MTESEPPPQTDAGDRFNAHRDRALAILADSNGQLTIGEANAIAAEQLAAEERQQRRDQ